VTASSNSPDSSKNPSRHELKIALVATLFFGAAGGIFTATLNNYLAEVHNFGAEARGWLEFPRELPGFLMIFVSGAMLTLWRETQMAALAMLFTALGGRWGWVSCLRVQRCWWSGSLSGRLVIT